MRDEFTDVQLRQFLLGKVTDEERQEIESLFLTDTQLKERVLAVEEELIDDYLEGALTTEDREQFLLQFGQTPEQQRKLRIAQSIKEWAMTESAQSQGASSGNGSSKPWRFRPALVLPIALAAVILIVAAIWLWTVNDQRNRHAAIEEQLARLNSSSHSLENPSQILSLDLSPVTVRSGSQQAEVKPRSDTRIVELRLPWIQAERYATYQAEIWRAGDDESFAIRNLQPASDQAHAVRIRLPVPMLRRGQYQVRLRGVAGGGALSSAEEYTFTVLE